ncbi:MAG TPA: hypothetical protein VK604_00480 [Bryobacteraceae bacterium]|nr:hypothetical protein [Bryobacteraceae bacterium]
MVSIEFSHAGGLRGDEEMRYGVDFVGESFLGILVNGVVGRVAWWGGRLEEIRQKAKVWRILRNGQSFGIRFVEGRLMVRLDIWGGKVCDDDEQGPALLSVLPLARFSRTLEIMEVQLTSDQQAFARRAIESGRFQTEQDAVHEALALWEERERQRVEFLVTLEDARASLARGEGRVITQESMRELASEVKERGRARLLAELASSR